MKRLLRRWLQKILYDDTENMVPSSPSKIRSQVDEAPVRMNFCIYPADGGQVVEIERFDTRSRNHVMSVYLITNDEDFTQRLSRIITLEGLKQ